MYAEMFALHAELLKALAHPRRLEIVHLLRDQELPVTNIHTMLDLPQANISQHLMILRDAGIVNTRRKGKQIYYKLAHPNIIKASDLMRKLLIQRHKGRKLADELTKRMSELVPITTDPVCGMRLSPVTAAFAKAYRGTNYYFCASGCFETFQKKPNIFMQKGA